MATVLPSRPRQANQRHNFAIVVSTYHDAYARGLVEHTQREVEALTPGSQIEIFKVPGSFEIPLMVQAVAETGEFEAVIAFGVLMEGQTAHATLISTAVTEALMGIGLETRTPIIHEVLVVTSEEQAQARCIGDEINRGTEAARVAVKMANAMGRFPRRSHSAGR